MTIHTLKNLLIGLLILVLLLSGVFFIKDWLRPRIITALGGYTSSKTLDTITKIEIKRDTIYKLKPITTIVRVTEPSKETKQTSSFNGKISTKIDSIYTYNNPVQDSLLQGFIKTVVQFPSGKMLSQQLDYKPKFPILVKETQTVTKIVEKVLENKPKAYIGVGAIGTNTNQIGGAILYQTPKKWQIQAGYLVPLNNAINTPKEQIQISIHKLF